MTAIIFGANGQDGYYLSRLIEQDCRVIGISRSGNFIKLDMARFDQVADLIKKYRPEYIFHLAAVSTTSHDAWQENHETICTGSLNILESVKQFSPHSRIFLSGSGLQFINDGRPIKETDSFDGSSIYSVSRIHSVFAARYYRRLGVKVYVGYFFNHDSPLRSGKHINKKITEAVNSVLAGKICRLEIGDMDVKKEFGFAGDIVKAIWILVRQDSIFEAVIGTGKAYSIRQWVEYCFSRHGLKWQEYVIPTKNFTAEYKILVSDPSVIFSLGWKPETSFEQLANLMLES